MTRTLAALALSTALATSGAGQERPLPDFNTFVAQVKTRLQTDSERQSGYTYTERRTEQKLDSDGKVKDQTIKVFEVYPGLPGEDRYLRLIEEDGRPVPQKDLEKRDRERQQKVERYAREQQTLSEADRQKQLREYQKAMKKRAEEIDDIFNVFDVRMVGRESLNAHDTIVFTLTPKADRKPKTDSGEIMQHFTARAWISESDYELAQIHVEAIDNLTFGLGLLARIDKGSKLTFVRRKVNGEIWLPSLVTYRGSGRVLLVKGMRLGGSSEFSNYRKFTVDTTTVIGEAGPSSDR